MFQAKSHPFLITADSQEQIAKLPTTAPRTGDKKKLKKQLAALTDELAELQRKLYADDRHALLLVFQAMDAAGKDSTIRSVLSGVNPAGCQVFCFKQPSANELDHDFLWRSAKSLPERGRIGVFNRSYYEEVLVVRVHPEYLDGQKLPGKRDLTSIWPQRFESIRTHEEHLARNGTVILKFWLNVSKDEQRRRFLSRLDEPHKNWKFSESDLQERQLWDSYMLAYADMLANTSRSHAPWYAIPADDKPQMRVWVAQIVVDTLKQLKLSYPRLRKADLAQFDEYRKRLQTEQ